MLAAAPYSRIEKLLKQTKDAVEESGKQIDGIVTDTREKIHSLKDELIEVEARIAAIIMMVDSLDRSIVELRTKAKICEATYGKGTIETKTIYAQIKDFTVKSEQHKKDESALRLRRDNIERFLKENGELLVKSEKVLQQVLVAISYLEIESLPSSDTTVLRVINASDAEKKRLSRDIHDGPAQSLVNIMLIAEYAEKMVDVAPIQLKNELRSIRIAAKDTLTDIRRIIFDLMPYTMTDYGLIETLSTFMQNRKGIPLDIKIEENAKIVSTVIENNLFRIVQEIHSNIVKHARAKEARLHLRIDKDEVILTVQDDGIGFDLNNHHAGYGLISISDRVELLNGTLEIVSNLDRGTTVKVVVPNKEDYEKDIRNG